MSGPAPPRRPAFHLLCGAAIVAGMALPAAPAHATTFSNAAPIPVADGTGTAPFTRGLGSPYPSSIAVSGLTGKVARVSVALRSIGHANPDDLDAMLVGPAGQRVVLLSDAGESFPVSNLTLGFADAAAAKAPDTTALVGPVYRPSDLFGGLGEEALLAEFPPPAPAKPGVTDGGIPLSAFDGTDPNGTWTLYVTDDRPGATGGIAGGWVLDIATAPPPQPAIPPVAGVPPPVLGRRVNVKRVSGKVLVSVPGSSGARTSATVPGLKGRRFVSLASVRQIPVGSFLDTRRGTVRLTSARDSRGTVQSGRFARGVFQVRQSRRRSARGLTELRLKGGSTAGCRGARRSEATSSRRRRIIRRLRSNTRGRFKASTKHSSGTTRGTVWKTAEGCDTTLTEVSRGAVAVRDFRRRKTVTIRSGQGYEACGRNVRDGSGRFRTCGRYSAATVRGG